MRPINTHITSQNYLLSYKSFSLFILLALLSLPVLSKPFAAGGQAPGLHMQRVADRLDLSQQQREEIGTILLAAKTTHAVRGDAMQVNREALQRLINSESPDQAKIQSLAEVQGDLFAEKLLQKAAVTLQVYAILTAEQRIKMIAYTDIRQEMRVHRKKQRKHDISEQQRR